MNTANFGIMTGRLSKDPVFRTNSDNSRKVFITLAVKNNFVGKDGQKDSVFLNLEGFIPKDKTSSVYDLLDCGAPITVQYTVKPNNYEKDGQKFYGQVLQIEDVRLDESKAERDARQARKAAKAAAADAAAEA